MIAKENPGIDFSSYIIKGALKNYAYDGQAEPNRAQYIFDLYLLSDKKDKIRKAIIEGIAKEQKDTWSLTHLFAIAKIFAQKGDSEMRQAIYDRFCFKPIEYSDWLGYPEILELDGLEGLIFIAEKYGKFIETNPTICQDDHIIRQFQKDNPALKVMETLENLAKVNKHIRIYLENIKQTKAFQEKNQHKKKKYRDIVDEVLNGKNIFFSIRNLTKEEINQLAKQLVIERDKSNIENLLYVFILHKFPFGNRIILDFAKQKKTTKNLIVEYAISALQHLQSSEIRAFAIEKIKTSKNPIEYLEILISNYESGDCQLLSQIATQTNNEDDIEILAQIYSNIYNSNKTTECQQPLEILYNKMTCGIHRNVIVNILIDNKVLSEKIRSEIQFDSNIETRQIRI